MCVPNRDFLKNRVTTTNEAYFQRAVEEAQYSQPRSQSRNWKFIYQLAKVTSAEVSEGPHCMVQEDTKKNKVVLASTPIIVFRNRKRAAVATVGVHMKHSNLTELLLLKTECAQRNLTCYLIDEQAFIVAHIRPDNLVNVPSSSYDEYLRRKRNSKDVKKEEKDLVGKYECGGSTVNYRNISDLLAERKFIYRNNTLVNYRLQNVEGEIMQDLLSMGIFYNQTMENYQAMCRTDAKTDAAPRLSNIILSLYRATLWLLTTTFSVCWWTVLGLWSAAQDACPLKTFNNPTDKNITAVKEQFKESCWDCDSEMFSSVMQCIDDFEQMIRFSSLHSCVDYLPKCRDLIEECERDDVDMKKKYKFCVPLASLNLLNQRHKQCHVRETFHKFNESQFKKSRRKQNVTNRYRLVRCSEGRVCHKYYTISKVPHSNLLLVVVSTNCDICALAGDYPGRPEVLKTDERPYGDAEIKNNEFELCRRIQRKEDLYRKRPPYCHYFNETEESQFCSAAPQWVFNSYLLLSVLIGAVLF